MFLSSFPRMLASSVIYMNDDSRLMCLFRRLLNLGSRNNISQRTINLGLSQPGATEERRTLCHTPATAAPAATPTTDTDGRQRETDRGWRDEREEHNWYVDCCCCGLGGEGEAPPRPQFRYKDNALMATIKELFITNYFLKRLSLTHFGLIPHS